MSLIGLQSNYNEKSCPQKQGPNIWDSEAKELQSWNTQ